MTRPALAALLLLPVTACTTTSTGCVPTTMATEDASKVDLASPGRSSTVSARLTEGEGQPLPGKRVTFELKDDGAGVHEATATSGSDGWARIDLKRADPNTVLALVRADEVAASFAGDSRYCSSADEAPFRIVRR